MIVRRDEFAPRHHTDNGEINRAVDERDAQNAPDDRARDDSAGVSHFVTDVADVVITEVIIDADARSRTQTQEEARRKFKGVRWKGEGALGLEVAGAGENDCRHWE